MEKEIKKTGDKLTDEMNQQALLKLCMEHCLSCRNHFDLIAYRVIETDAFIKLMENEVTVMAKKILNYE